MASTKVLGLGLGLLFNGVALAIPSLDEIDILSVQANGSGCPVGSTTELIVDTDGSGSADFFQVTFNQFNVERPGRVKKNCLVEVLLDRACSASIS